MKKISAMIMAITLVMISVNINGIQAATKLKVSNSKITLTVGKEKTVTANKKVTWKSSNKKIVTVKKVTSKKAKLQAVKSGTCTVTAKNGKSKAVIHVTVKKNKITKPAATKKPSATVVPTPKSQHCQWKQIYQYKVIYQLQCLQKEQIYQYKVKIHLPIHLSRRNCQKIILQMKQIL